MCQWIRGCAVACVVLSVNVGVAPAGDPLRTEIVCVKHDTPITLEMLKGRVAIVHLLPSMETPQASAFVEMLVRRAPELAGTYHVVVSPCDVKALEPLGKLMAGSSVTVGCDKDGELRSALVGTGEPATPVTVLLGVEGSELARLTSPSAAELPDYDKVARLVNDTTRSVAVNDYNLPKGKALAVEGYDLVAYFEQAGAIKGKPELASWYHGVEYRFASEDSRRRFAQTPAKYLPTYGGWCASAMGAKGAKVEIDPRNFKIKDGRLFLFYKSAFGDALKDWNRHEAEWEPSADANWRKLTGEDAGGVIPNRP